MYTTEAPSEARGLQITHGLQCSHSTCFVYTFELGRLYPKGNLGHFQVGEGIILASSSCEVLGRTQRLLFCLERWGSGEPPKWLLKSASDVHGSLNCAHEQLMIL